MEYNIKESEDIMTKKSKTNLNTIDKEEIIKILIKENENKNEFLVMFSQTKEKFLKEKLQEINKEIELIAIKIAEEYIKQNKKEVKKSYDDKEEHNYFNISFDEEIVIRSSLTYKNLDIEYNNIKSGTKIILYDAHGRGSQSFLKVDNNDGTFSFKKYGYALDVRFSEIKNGTQIQIWEYNGTKAQKFYLKDRGNGYASIHSAINKNYCIDVSNSGTHNFNKIQLWESNGTSAQKFKLIPINIQKNEREENERNRIKEEEHRRMQEENHRKHIEDLARRTIKGEFGSGEERKNRLGGEFKEVQNKVNEILGCSFRYKI